MAAPGGGGSGGGSGRRGAGAGRDRAGGAQHRGPGPAPAPTRTGPAPPPRALPGLRAPTPPIPGPGTPAPPRGRPGPPDSHRNPRRSSERARHPRPRRCPGCCRCGHGRRRGPGRARRPLSARHRRDRAGTERQVSGDGQRYRGGRAPLCPERGHAAPPRAPAARPLPRDPQPGCAGHRAGVSPAAVPCPDVCSRGTRGSLTGPVSVSPYGVPVTQVTLRKHRRVPAGSPGPLPRSPCPSGAAVSLGCRVPRAVSLAPGVSLSPGPGIPRPPHRGYLPSGAIFRLRGYFWPRGAERVGDGPCRCHPPGHPIPGAAAAVPRGVAQVGSRPSRCISPARESAPDTWGRTVSPAATGLAGQRLRPPRGTLVTRGAAGGGPGSCPAPEGRGLRSFPGEVRKALRGRQGSAPLPSCSRLRGRCVRAEWGLRAVCGHTSPWGGGLGSVPGSPAGSRQALALARPVGQDGPVAAAVSPAVSLPAAGASSGHPNPGHAGGTPAAFPAPHICPGPSAPHRPMAAAPRRRQALPFPGR
ncbi:collagen alpha-1(II) chain-like [Ammospiza caudacuta]|uniref:collagen alpha-1(II) chain-like n=1 Tax=Ammospiza caudacuta TaxID=2857398 RepID=UPI0027382A75|nr:collagen alpha-1(II) chain-like [Ammospiza caudacuta]